MSRRPNDRIEGLRASTEPLAELPPPSPLDDLLAGCEFFLVDDDCGRAVGVVDEVVVAADSAGPPRLVVVLGRQHVAVPLDDVLEIDPGSRRLMVACRSGHRPPAAAGDAAEGASVFADFVATVFSAVRRPGGPHGGSPRGDGPPEADVHGSTRPRRMA